jgi:hypothetical protein
MGSRDDAETSSWSSARVSIAGAGSLAVASPHGIPVGQNIGTSTSVAAADKEQTVAIGRR